MLGKGKKNLDFKNYKGLKPTKINNKEGEEVFYGYGYTGKYLNNGEPIDFENYHGQLPNFGTHKPVELQPSDLGYSKYVGSGGWYRDVKYPGPRTSDEADYGTTDPNFVYDNRAYRNLVVKRTDSLFSELRVRPPSPPPQDERPTPRQPRRGKIPMFFGF
ncbi:hypothetical protein MKW92_004219 [Papaver armeniacum]|nr:hypothetical protein MKW92_004219 [Papaver armeniacum]